MRGKTAHPNHRILRLEERQNTDHLPGESPPPGFQNAKCTKEKRYSPQETLEEPVAICRAPAAGQSDQTGFVIAQILPLSETNVDVDRRNWS
jgi:hypothetical protein